MLLLLLLGMSEVIVSIGCLVCSEVLGELTCRLM